jgi:hypothetical protein
MNTVYLDPPTGAELRPWLYDGRLIVFSPRPSSLALVEHARAMIEEAFGDIPPREAQFHLPVERYVEICAPLKPRFIHHPHTKQLVADVIAELGCDLDRTYLDVPRLRMVTSDGYLTSGVGYAHHPHRDTWYSAPLAQLNWWLPIYQIASESSLAFHPRYWSEPVRNGSAGFDYYEWNTVGRKDAAKQVKSDTRKQPKPEQELELEPEVRLVVPPGGIVLFSAAQLHSTVPNTSGSARFSIDFRTVDLDDVIAGAGAPNLDSAPTGTSLRDFLRGRDLERFPEEIAARFDDPARRVDPDSLVFRPESAAG